MLTSAIALLFTALVAYSVVDGLLWLAGSNRIARSMILVAALVTGFIVPWAVLNALAGVINPGDEA